MANARQANAVAMMVTNRNCKKVDVNCRHGVALTGLDRHKERVVMALFRRLQRVHAEFINVGNDVEARRVRRFIRRVIKEYVNISTVPQKITFSMQGIL